MPEVRRARWRRFVLPQRLGQRLFVISEDPGLAKLMKLGADTLIATTFECMGEVLGAVTKRRDRPRRPFDSRVHNTYDGKIIEPRGDCGAVRDQGPALALMEAKHEAVPMPAASVV